MTPSPTASPTSSPTVARAAEGPARQARVSEDVESHVSYRSAGMLQLYLVLCIAFMATFMAGYAIAAMTAVNAIPSYQRYFDFDGLGVSTGLVFSVWPIGACTTFWLGPILSDKLGRRGGMFICSLLFLLGTSILAFSRNVGMLLAARPILGASVGMIQPAAPPYIIELAPPQARGMMTGLFNVCWVLGAVVATGISIGTSRMTSNLAWRIPLIVQLVPGGIIVGAVLFLPESPRWLFINRRPEEAQRILQKYHGNGQLTPLVLLELQQITDSMSTTASLWNYRELVGTRSSRYRLLLAVLMGVFGQLSGNALSYFLPALYKQVGVTNVQRQLVMTLIASVVSLVGGLVGTYHTDRLGCRKVLIGGTLACAVTLACAMGSSAASHVELGRELDGDINRSASRAAIAFLILFGAAYGWGYLPLLPTYPSECLRTEQRSTGVGLVVLTSNVASFINQFAIPIALKQIGWWTYLPFICWDLIEAVVWYLVAVETKNRTLEELDEIFNAQNPVKASLKFQRAADLPRAPVTNAIKGEEAA